MLLKRSRKLGAVLIAAALVFSLAGCATTPAPAGSSTPAPGSTASQTSVSATPPTAITAGTYTATAKGHASDISVEVTVDNTGKITALKANADSETPKIGGEAAPKMVASILSAQRLDVDIIAGATVTSKAILAATEDGLIQAGVDTATLKAAATGAAADEAITVDVAIIGGGASGTAAAAAAIDGGAKVLMVEKNGNIGGISRFFAGGPFAVQSHLQKEAGPAYSTITSADALQTLNDYAHYINYAPLTKAIVEKSGDTISWLESWGITFHLNPESPQLAHRDDDMKWKNYHWYDLFSYEATDKAAIDVVHENLAKKGLDLRLNTIGTRLITDSSGAVTGFVATKEDGSTLTVTAKTVVVATGGFAGNGEMMQEYYNTPYLGQWGEDGAGVKMAWDVGAAKWDTASSLLHGNGLVPATNPTDVALANSPFDRIVRSPLLWIDQSGNRFCNEEAVWDTAYTSNAGYSVGGVYYILVDKATLDGYTQGKTLVMDTAIGGPNTEAGDFLALAEEGVKQGIITKGATLEELAKNLGMEPSRLISNVEEYNAAIQSKEDAYGKTAASLVYSVSEGPFYAAKMQISNLGTLGGVRVNEKLQATNVDLKPIPGLYVVGNDAAGFYGNITSYPSYEGLATGFAWNSGRIAGENAAIDIKAKN